jgi:D-glycero-D-manno-heptose 1,7-bisphosphate phosphatase
VNNGGNAHRAVFLDRDGVLNAAIIREGIPYPPSSCEELKIPEGVPEALELLKEAGFLLIGITNQPDVARATQSKAMVEAINSRLLSLLPLKEIFTCYHDDQDSCQCRKPEPGLLLEASKKYSIQLPQSFVVGDRWKDIEAGHRAGCRTIWLDFDHQEPNPQPPADLTVLSLIEAVPWILWQSR